MTAPNDRFQVEFLTKLQRLLSEGEFVSTYKFALLIALADVAIEQGDDTGDALPVQVDDIAEKFIRSYWRQTLPYAGTVLEEVTGKPVAGTVLEQSTGKRAAIIGNIIEAQKKAGTLTAFTRDERRRRKLIKDVRTVITKMPLFKLQTLGGEPTPFLYDDTKVTDGRIVLKPGIAFCLRRFHGLVEDLVRGAWVRFIRRLPKNRAAVGESLDLPEFLFGSERDALTAFKPILSVLQKEACFYCQRKIPPKAHAVDHFVPWSLFPNDLGHNLVLTDAECNSSKSDALASTVHLERWRRQVDRHGQALATQFESAGIVHNQAASMRVTNWAYANAELASAQLWIAGKKFEPIDASWRAMVGC